MKHILLKIIIASICFLPFVVLAGARPDTPIITEVIVYTKESNVALIAGITTITLGAIAIARVIKKKWKKKP